MAARPMDLSCTEIEPLENFDEQVGSIAAFNPLFMVSPP